MLCLLHYIITKLNPAPPVPQKPKYKLSYFNGRARGEVIRWIFAAAGQEYEDCRLDDAGWAQLKPRSPFGQLPVLEIDGEMWCQSWVIARMLAKRFGLAGKTEHDEHRANMIVDCVDDLFRCAVKLKFASDEERSGIEKKWSEEQEPRFCSNFEKLLLSNNGRRGYFVGDELTWADIAVCVWMGWAKDLDYEPYPALAAHRTRVIGQPGISEWLSKRPETGF